MFARKQSTLNYNHYVNEYPWLKRSSIFFFCIVLKSSPARWVDPKFGPGARTRLGLRKNKESQNPGWPSKKPDCNPLIFVFFLLKWCHFNFLKKLKWTRTTWWPDQNLMIWSKLRTWVLSQVNYWTGSKTMFSG